MAKKYGNSWWGQQWLNALKGIDYDNRLPRGRTYANKGAVLDIQINENVVHAKVQGSRRTPYKQILQFKLFTQAEKESILNTITDNPFILSQLLNKEIPKELYNNLKKKGIILFPTSWNSLAADCSCPDWALPCKHLAAVIYLIGNEIDRNPFLVFQLRGLDVLKHLVNFGFDQKGEFKLSIKSVENVYTTKQPKIDKHFEFDKIATVDFSIIAEKNTHHLLKLLTENPVFNEGSDFKKIIEKSYSSLKRTISFFTKKESNNKEYDILNTSSGDLHIELDGHLHFKCLQYSSGSEQVSFTKEDDLVEVAVALNPINYPYYTPSAIVFSLAYRFSLELGDRNACIPELLQIEENTYVVRWIPALLIPEVKKIFDTLLALMPQDMLYLHATGSKHYPKKEERLKMLLAVFLNYYQHLSSIKLSYQSARYADDLMKNVFFNQKILETSRFSNQQLAQSIQKWLQKFYLSEKEWTPVLKIEESEQAFFELSLWIENTKDALQALVSLQDLFSREKHKKIRTSVLQDIALLAEYLPGVQKIINNKGKDKLIVSYKDFTSIIFETIPALRLLNIKILMPKALQKLAKPQLSGKVNTQGKVAGTTSFANLKNLLQFDWQVAIGEEVISAEEFRKLVNKTKGLVKINNQYVLLDEKEIAAILKKLDKPPKLNQNDLLRILLSEDYNGAKAKLDKKAKELLHQISNNKAVDLPKGLKATLRPYQLRGYTWLYLNQQLGFGSLLADDMGLGKTLQVICLLLKMREEGKLDKQKALMVLPTTLLGNWQKEINKFAPELEVAIYHGIGRKFTDEGYDVMLTSYGVLRSDIKILQKENWAVFGIDEAQNIKNVNTEQTKAVKKINCENRIALSGTPVENRLSEYWSIIDFTNKGYLNSLPKFKTEFVKPIEVHRDQNKVAHFKKVTAPFILRRLKTDKSIISDLPEKIEADQLCSLTKAQSALYENVVKSAMKSIEQEEDITRLGLVFKLMISLKQICNHPSHFLKKQQIDPSKSGKTAMLLSLLDTIHENGEKTLIFTQYKEMGDLLVKLIKEKYHYDALWLHGGVSRKKRDTMVNDFQKKHYCKTMILSLKAGGTGLNLTAANNVIHYDLWWNPAVENQATDRAYRIGQQKNVMVYRMITQGTFEEKINEMIKSKKELADMTVGTGENWIGDLNNQQLKEIFNLG